MYSGFNEIQYSYSVVSEMERMSGRFLLLPPFFPTLNAEGNLGYDLRLDIQGCPVFLQFKLSDYLTKANAREWNHYYSPYYRFKIYPTSKSNQHNALVTLSLAETYVFYCSPRFYKETDYNQFHFSNQICNNSKMTPCNLLPFISGSQEHYVTYKQPAKP